MQEYKFLKNVIWVILQQKNFNKTAFKLNLIQAFYLFYLFEHLTKQIEEHPISLTLSHIENGYICVTGYLTLSDLHVTFQFAQNVHTCNKWFWNHESRLNIHQVCGYSDSFCKNLK